MSFSESPRRFDAVSVYYLLEGGTALLFHLFLPIYVVYYTVMVGLDPLEIVLVGTVFEATIFLFEIPTGVVADVYSRRLSILVGLALTGVGLVLEGAIPVFGWILIAEVISGIGATFLSGATQAWITDEIGVERASRAFLRAAQIRTAAGIAGIGIGVMLASAGLNWPFVAAGGLFLALALVLSVIMPETGFRRTPQAERSTWQTLFSTFREGTRMIHLRPVLIPILLIEFLFAFHSEGFDHLWQKHILDYFILPGLGNLDPVVWFGIISLSANVLSIILNEIVRRRVNLDDHPANARVLMLIYGVSAVSILVFALSVNFYLAMAAYCLAASVRGTGKPVSDAWLNQHVEPDIRATMFSINGQIGSMGETIGGPPIGAIARVSSLRVALSACGLILAGTLPLFGVAQRHEVARATVE